ncbi:MAG: FKBP-type peptidyl-prolyl cis-trans isomerase [Bacteroidota bacterium]
MKRLIYLFGLLAFFSCETNNVEERELLASRQDQILQDYFEENNIDVTRTADGIYFRVLETGTGTRNPQLGSNVTVHYEGRFLDGKVFDSSYLRDNTFDFTLGVGQVIRGWDLAVPQMVLGEVTEFYIPSQLAYGSSGSGNTIPPNTPLVFQIELLGL